MKTVPTASRVKPMVLLGAGASVDAGIPCASDMTRKMIEHFQSYEGPEVEKTLKVLKFVVKHSKCGQEDKEKSPLQGIDIEKLFAVVAMLARRQELEIAPFVDHWHPCIQKFEKSKNIFVHTTENMVRMLREIVWIQDLQRVNYLTPLVERGKKAVFNIATLNYDNTIERAGELIGVPIEDGLENWLQYGSFRKPEKGIELLKLHGSIDWSMTENTWQRKAPIPHDVIRRVQEGRGGFPYLWPALVFGAGNKLTARGPFLDLLQTFKLRLEEHDTLFAVGYSFRDEHINETITRWFNKSQTRRIIVIDREGAPPINNDFSRVRTRFEQRSVGARNGIADFFQ